jgi:hypothetical protein
MSDKQDIPGRELLELNQIWIASQRHQVKPIVDQRRLGCLEFL